MKPEDGARFAGEYIKVYSHDDVGMRWVRRGDIPSLLDGTFYEALDLWVKWRRFGLPHGGGWIHESERTVQLITVVDEEWALFENKERESRRGDSGRTKGRHKGRS